MSSTTGLIAESEFVALDLETTGLQPEACHIVEIGAVRFRGDGQVLDKYCQLVHPGYPIPERVIRIHGITDEMVADQPDIYDVLPQFLDYLGNQPTVLLAHNARFDVGFLSAALRRVGCPDVPYPVVDTWPLARRWLPLPDYRLETIGRYLRLIERERHRALDDALLVQQVFCYLVRQQRGVRTVRQLLETVSPLSLSAAGSDFVEPLPGYEVLWEAMGQHLPIVICYDGGSRPGACRVITPRHVTRSRGVFYVAAFCHSSGADKTFRLDRIASCEWSQEVDAEW